MDSIDFYPACMHGYLDVSEFTMVGEPEQFGSPLLRPLPVVGGTAVSGWAAAGQFTLFGVDADSADECDLAVIPLDDLELVTPSVHEDDQSASDREHQDLSLNHEHVQPPFTQSFGDDFTPDNDMDNNSEMEDASEIEEEADAINVWNNNMDLLDALEQHYEREHRRRRLETAAEPAANKLDQGSASEAP